MKTPFLLRPTTGCRLLALVAVAATTALADDPPTDDEAPITRLSLHAAAEPRPALRYRLLPSMLDLRPGNAAVFYNKAALMLRELPEADKGAEQAGEWMDLPLDKFPREEAAEAIGRWSGVLREIGYAAHRQQCDWQMPLREQMPYDIMLPELQALRNVARMLWRDLDRVRGAAEWRRMYDDLVDGLKEIDSSTAGKYDRLRIVGRAVKRYARAKSWLIDRGWSPEAVEGMTAPQVVVLTTIGAYNDLGDQMVKWAHLPYSQVRGLSSSTEKLIAEEARSREIVPLASMLLPAVDAARHAQARNDRAFALERAIEALRLYAAGHEGRLPKQLADVTEAPVPDDPLMGGPFSYRLSGKTTMLEAPSPPGLPAKYNGVRYEITIVQ